MRTRYIRIATLLLLAAVLAAGLWVVDLRSEKAGYFVERRGELSEALLQSSERQPGGMIDERLRLTADTGLAVEIRIRRPDIATGTRLPVLLMVGGHRTGRDAVALAGAPEDVAYAAIDYPYDGSHRLRGIGQTLAAIPHIQRAFLDTPPALSLALQWLLTQDWAEPDHVELVGVSLGVPFAAAAGAADSRFSRVWLIHGAGNNHAWLRHNLRESFPVDWQRGIMNEIFYTLIRAESFRTARWVRAIPPTPVVIIAAREDERLPPAALAPLPDIAASEPAIDLVWTEGLHIDPDRPDVIGQLLDIVLERVRADSGAAQNRQITPSEGKTDR